MTVGRDSHAMRALLIVLLASGACAPGTGGVRGLSPPAEEGEGVSLRVHSDVAAARELDREGIRSYREGRYVDAIRYFRAAYRLGGPSSELWNIARTREKIDDLEGADSAIQEYLAKRDLSAQDRAEADREGRALRARASVLTVTTSPAGAVVVIDGKQTAGPTPVSVEVSAGRHTIAVRRDGHATEARPVEARFGRAVIVALDLLPASK
jgi:hypothetical protein